MAIAVVAEERSRVLRLPHALRCLAKRWRRTNWNGGARMARASSQPHQKKSAGMHSRSRAEVFARYSGGHALPPKEPLFKSVAALASVRLDAVRSWLGRTRACDHGVSVSTRRYVCGIEKLAPCCSALFRFDIQWNRKMLRTIRQAWNRLKWLYNANKSAIHISITRCCAAGIAMNCQC